MEWLEDWLSPGVCQLARCQVVHKSWWSREARDPSVLWLLAHEGEAAIVDAPFSRADAPAVLDAVSRFLNEKGMRLKFALASSLVPDRAAGLAVLLERFPEAKFVYPAEWVTRLRPSLFAKSTLSRGELARCWAHKPQLQYQESVSLDLGGEPLLAFDSPLHGLTDQVIVFRGVALSPDWYSDRATQAIAAQHAEKNGDAAAPVERLRQASERHGYTIHSFASVNGSIPLSGDFFGRLERNGQTEAETGPRA
jgi:hypothetical protein